MVSFSKLFKLLTNFMELLKFALKLLGTLEFGVLLRRILAATTISGASKFRLSCVWCHFQFIHCSIVIGLVAFWLIDAFSCFPDLSLSFPYLFHVNFLLLPVLHRCDSSGGFGNKPSRSHNISELVSRCSVF